MVCATDGHIRTDTDQFCRSPRDAETYQIHALDLGNGSNNIPAALLRPHVHADKWAACEIGDSLMQSQERSSCDTIIIHNAAGWGGKTGYRLTLLQQRRFRYRRHRSYLRAHDTQCRFDRHAP